MKLEYKHRLVCIVSIVILVAILSAIILGAITDGCTDWSFGKKSEMKVDIIENEEISTDELANMVTEDLKIETIETTLDSRVLLSSGVAEASEDGTISKTITATVLPENAIDKSVDWSIEWETPVVEGADISEYLTIYVARDGANACVLTAHQGFEGGKAVLTCTTRIGQQKASCYVTYVGAPQTISFIVEGEEYQNTNEVDLLTSTTTNIELKLNNVLGSVGSQFGTYEITALGMNGRFTALETEVLNGTVVATNEVTVNLQDGKAGVISYDTTYFFNASINGNILSIECIRNETAFWLPQTPAVRTGKKYEYVGTYTDPRSGGVPDDCVWYVEVTETVSGKTSLLYIDIQSNVTDVSLSNASIEF